MSSARRSSLSYDSQAAPSTSRLPRLGSMAATTGLSTEPSAYSLSDVRGDRQRHSYLDAPRSGDSSNRRPRAPLDFLDTLSTSSASPRESPLVAQQRKTLSRSSTTLLPVDAPLSSWTKGRGSISSVSSSNSDSLYGAVPPTARRSRPPPAGLRFTSSISDLENLGLTTDAPRHESRRGLLTETLGLTNPPPTPRGRLSSLSSMSSLPLASPSTLDYTSPLYRSNFDLSYPAPPTQSLRRSKTGHGLTSSFSNSLLSPLSSSSSHSDGYFPTSLASPHREAPLNSPFASMSFAPTLTRSPSSARLSTSHTGGPTPPGATFVCYEVGCGEIMHDAADFVQHRKSHADKPFACALEGCGKRFGRLHDCKRHERTHTKETPYECKACGKGFQRSDTLKKHLRSTEECRYTLQ